MVFLYSKYIGYTFPFITIITTNDVPIKSSSLSKLSALCLTCALDVVSMCMHVCKDVAI